MILTLALALLLAVLKLITLSGPYRAGMLQFIVSMLDWVRGLGAWGVPMLFLCESIFFLLLIPISFLHVGVGFMYGFAAGCPIAWTAYAIGWYAKSNSSSTPLLHVAGRPGRRC